VLGGLCPHFPTRIVDHNELAEVELVSEPFAFGFVQDPLIVVIPGESRLRIETQPSQQAGLSCSWRTLAIFLHLRTFPKPWKNGNQTGVPETTALFSELCPF
jgi:hypothetical protein